jgi:hypothetical protein
MEENFAHYSKFIVKFSSHLVLSENEKLHYGICGKFYHILGHFGMLFVFLKMP